MSFTFTPAVRDRVPLLIGLGGASGSGKTMSALRLAVGLASGGKIVMIDTEAGRGKHYAPAPGQRPDPARGTFPFDHCGLEPPFTPERYVEAIEAAHKIGAEVVVIDSMSHEWNGDGGCIDIHDEIATRMATNRETGEVDTRRLEALSAPAWREPKMRHKRMVSRLLQCRAHLIFCMRAEEKIRFVKVKDDRGRERTAIEPAGWMPIAEKSFPYELTLSFTLAPDTPGIPRFDLPHKLQEQHRAFFPENEFIGEAAGDKLRQWAAGGAAPAAQPAPKPFLERIQDRLDSARTPDDVHAIENAKVVQTALSDAPQEIQDQLNAMLRVALARVEGPDGDWQHAAA